MYLLSRRDFTTQAAALGAGSLLLAACSKPDDPRTVLLKAKIEEWERGIPQWLADAKLPGASILFLEDGKVFWQGVFGMKDAVTKEAVDFSTVFAACSNTKPVFGYAVAKLCEKGVMDLDTPLVKYTDRRIVENDPRLDMITARHVLSHSTGFPNWRGGDKLEIQFTPGSKYQYSGEGYSYLQSVVQEVTGQPFADFMRVNILEPFSMTNSRFVWDDAYARHIAKPHDKDGKRIEERPQTAEEKANGLATYGAAAMLHTTPGDYAKFLLEILAPKPADNFRLSEMGLREYLKPRVTMNGAAASSQGWVVGELNGATIFTHAGSAAGWNCDVTASPGLRAGFIVMTNGDNFQPFREKLKLDLDFYKKFFVI